MTIIAVKKEKNKITIWSDTMVTSRNVWYTKKIKTVWEIVYWWAWYLNELQIMERYLKDNNYDEKTIKSESDLFSLFSNFYKYLKDKWIIDDRETWGKTVFNDFIFVIKNLKKVYLYSGWCITEIEDFNAIWSWSSNALPILDETWSIEKAINYAKKYNTNCGWDTDILEIKI